MAEGMNGPHELTLKERKKLSMTGAQEVVSFDENCVVIRTSLGVLVIQGRNLQLKQLMPEGGNVAVEGDIEGLRYEQQRAEGGWLGRLFR